MGFAVVADEVRTLAQRSAQAARDTSGLIEASIASAAAGAERVERVTERYAAITDEHHQHEVARRADRRGQPRADAGISQVSRAVVQMEQVTQSTAAAAEQSAAASEELNAQAQASTAVVERVAQLVMGAQHAAAGRDQPGAPRTSAGRRGQATRFDAAA